MNTLKRASIAFASVLGVFLGSFGLAYAATFVVQQGGTGATSFTAGQLLYGSGTSAVQTVATTTASCSGSATCDPFTVIGSSPITISATGGSGGTGTATTSFAATYPVTLSTSDSAITYGLDFGTTTSNTWGGTQTFTNAVTAPRFVANSASATSTFAGGIAAETSGFVYDFSSNSVGIGTADTSNGKLSVTGDSWFNGNVAMGGTAVNADAILIASKNVTNPTALTYGAFFSRTSVITSNNNQALIGGLFSAASSNNAFNYTASSYGLRGGDFSFNHQGSGTVTSAAGGKFLVYNTSTGAVTDAAAGHFSIQNLNASGTITRAYALLADTGFNLGGAIGTWYGLYVNTPPSNVTTSYGVYVNGTTKSYFGGNVGIGTTTPSELLSVHGNGLFSGNLSAANITATGTLTAANFVANSASATSTFAGGIAAETSGFVYDFSSGNVGIGTAAPTQPLTVAGSALITSTAAWASGQTARLYFGDTGHSLQVPHSSNAIWNNYNGIVFQNTAGTITPLAIGANAGVGGTQDVAIGGNITSFSPTYTGATMVVKGATGLVGIGTSTPNNKLDIYSTTKAAIGFSGASGSTNKWTIGYDVTNARFSIASSTALGTTDRLVILGNGNVGIGSTTPGTLLSLGDTGANTINISATATSTFGSGVDIRTGCFAINGTCLTSGSTSAGGADTQVQFNDGGTAFGGNAAFTFSKVGNTKLTATNASTTAFTVGSYFSSSGNAGFGTTTPAFTLSVNNAGSAFYIDSTGKLVGRDTTNDWEGRLSPTRSLVMQFGTSTPTWTATGTPPTSISPDTVAPFAGTARQVRCSVNTFLGVAITINGTPVTPSYFVASSTVGKVLLTGSNTFSAGDKIGLTAGTTTSATGSSAITGSCTLDVTETP